MRVTINLSRRIYVHRPTLLLGYGVLATILICLLALQCYDLLQWSNQRSYLESEIEEFEVQLGKRAGGNASLADIEQLAGSIEQASLLLEKDHYRWTELLDQLEEVIGPRIRLSSIQPNFKEKTIALAGQARDVAALRELLKSLSESESFRDHYLKSQSQGEESGRGKVRFINFSISVREALK